MHGCKHFHDSCSCKKPFTLLPFPTEKKDPHARKIWIKTIARADSKGKNWQPQKYDRICSIHFKENGPYPTENLGHVKQSSIPKPRKPPVKRPDPLPTTSVSKKPKIDETEVLQTQNGDHTYDYKCKCNIDCVCKGCETKDASIKSLIAKFVDVEDNVTEDPIIKHRNKKSSAFNPITTFLSTDNKVKTYTGLPTKDAFNSLFSMVEIKAKQMRYWAGTKKYTGSKEKPSHCGKTGPKRKTNAKEEMLIALMKLH